LALESRRLTAEQKGTPMRKMNTRFVAKGLVTGAWVASACVLGSLGVSSASADVVFQPDSTFGCGTCTVLFTGADQTSNTVVGHNNDGTLVTYNSSTVLFAKGGQAEIDAAGGGTFSDLSWSAAPPYTAETFAINVVDSGTVHLAVTTNDGVFDFDWLVSQNGEQKISIFAIAGEFITNVALTTLDAALSSFRQDRLTSAAIPLPPALILFGTALAGMGFLRRRRRAQHLSPMAS
jgi:hypothetical protein